MNIFETDRLNIRNLRESDSDGYFDMMGNVNVMSLVPRKVMSREESDQHLQKLLDHYQKQSDTKVWAIETKNEQAFIGLGGFLKNSGGDHEIGYRLREQFWRNGFCTEFTKGLISFGFEELKFEKIIADVAVTNLNSVKILEKFMSVEKEFFNVSDNCVDRRYFVLRTDWIEG
jgi:ribosomal-protein-alanine N-acetyltransferase